MRMNSGKLLDLGIRKFTLRSCIMYQ